MADNPFNNEDFRGELEKALDRKLKPVTDLLEKHEKDISKHEAVLNRAKGARWAIGGIIGGLWALFEWFFHSGSKAIK